MSNSAPHATTPCLSRASCDLRHAASAVGLVWCGRPPSARLARPAQRKAGRPARPAPPRRCLPGRRAAAAASAICPPSSAAPARRTPAQQARIAAQGGGARRAPSRCLWHARPARPTASRRTRASSRLYAVAASYAARRSAGPGATPSHASVCYTPFRPPASWSGCTARRRPVAAQALAAICGCGAPAALRVRVGPLFPWLPAAGQTERPHLAYIAPLQPPPFPAALPASGLLRACCAAAGTGSGGCRQAVAMYGAPRGACPAARWLQRRN